MSLSSDTAVSAAAAAVKRSASSTSTGLFLMLLLSLLTGLLVVTIDASNLLMIPTSLY